jgi:hypothetical protein
MSLHAGSFEIARITIHNSIHEDKVKSENDSVPLQKTTAELTVK